MTLAVRRSSVLLRPLAALACAATVALPAAAQVIDRMKESGEIRLAVRKDARPHSYVEGGVAAGYSVNVCVEAISRMLGRIGVENLKYVYVPVDASDRFDAIAEGRADLLCGAATVTLSRRDAVEFSLSTFVDGASVMMRADGPREFSALDGKRIGVLGGTTTEIGLSNTLKGMNMTSSVVAVDAHHAGLEALEAGEIDAYFADQSILQFLRADAKNPGALGVATNLLTVERHALALPLGDHAFRQELDRALSTMFRDGTMLKIFGRNFPDAKPGAGYAALLLLSGLPE